MIGTYNPNTNPATVDLNFERALYWVEVGAQPTDTVRNILSREGVYLMKHLRGGVKKGAFDEATAQKKFDAWKADKQNGLAKIAEADAKAKKDAAANALKAEKAVNEAIAKKVADKKAAEAARRLLRLPLRLRKRLQRLLRPLLPRLPQRRLLPPLKLPLRHKAA